MERLPSWRRGRGKERGAEGMEEKEREREKKRKRRKGQWRRGRETDRQAYLASTNLLLLLAQKLSWSFQPH